MVPLSTRSRKAMDGLHPDLIRVIERAVTLADSSTDFVVIEGVRSDQQAYINFGKGRGAMECAKAGCPTHYAQPNLSKVTWLKNPLGTNHRRHADGFGHAFDAYPCSPITMTYGPRFEAMAQLFLQAAHLEGVKLRWGADWDQDGKAHEKGETDNPHFELTA